MKSVALSVALSFCYATAASAQAQPPRLDVVLKPQMAGGHVDHIDVRTTIQSPHAQPGEAFLSAGIRLAGHRTGYDVSTFTVTDSRGTIPLVVKDDHKTVTFDRRDMSVSRPTEGDVTVTHSAPVFAVGQGSGPGLNLQWESQSVDGSGMLMLALPPPSEQKYRIRLRWDLSAMPKGSIGVSGYGEGTIERVGPASDLTETFYDAGPLHSVVNGPFGFYWSTVPAFDAEAVATRTAALFRRYMVFFSSHPNSYRVFMRRDGTGGTALRQSFAFGYSSASDKPSFPFRGIAHEMAHTFIKDISAGAEAGPDEGSESGAWYNEGAAEYYSSVLLLRWGLSTPQEFLESINDSIANYYPRPSRNMSIAAAAKDGFFTGNSVQSLAYGRGRLYLASVNTKIREKTGGKKSLDDVVFELNKLSLAGQPHGQSVFVKLVEGYVGPEAVSDHQAFLEGKLVVPPSNAFGPCFRRERADIGKFDLGFDESILIRHQDRVIKDLVAGSPGDKAGLRNGDEILKSPPMGGAYSVYGDPTATLTLKIKRGDQTFDISYLPRSGLIESYHWVRIPGVPDDKCRDL